MSERPPPEGAPPRPAAERHLAPLFEDPGLWPLLVVMAAVFATGLVALLVMSLHDRNPFAAAALIGLLFMSGDWAVRDLRARRFGTISRSLMALWLLAAAGAWLLIWQGWV